MDSDEDEEIEDDEVPDEDPRRTRRRSGVLNRFRRYKSSTKQLGFPLPSSDDL